ncbi:MAG TPA: hypothetical protein VFE36_05405, partial [Candidatus Baltobacteraceae bacterium]|nr:hypothetical protein [Candidatus Baltobacteraceae bacterium]
ALLGVLACATPAFAQQASDTKFKVVLKVVRKPCVVQVPATVSLDTMGKPELHLASLLSDCQLDGAPATLTVRIDPADKRTNVATINF